MQSKQTLKDCNMGRIKVSAPENINTNILLPSSKSICNRALIIKALSKHDGKIENLSECDDTFVMVRALSEMTDTIDIMAAGTAMRFLTAYLSVTEGEHIITGTERMRQRPIKILVDALRSLGADIEYTEKEGFPPLKIRGKELSGNVISLPGDISSQYISALMMIGPTLKNGLTLNLTGNIVSKPYINLTIQIMKEFGANAVWADEHTICISNDSYKPTPYYVESDWSAASYWYEMTALSDNARVELPGLFEKSFQGDAIGCDNRIWRQECSSDQKRKGYRQNGIRFRKPAGPGTDIRSDLLHDGNTVPLQWSAKSQDKRDRPNGCTYKRDEETGIRNIGKRRFGTVMGWRKMRS